MKLKTLSNSVLVALSALILTVTTAQAAEMQYMSREDLKNAVTSSPNNYILLDVRKAADYEKGHIASSASADMDPAVGVMGDNAKGIETLKTVLKATAGNETGAGKKVVILCYAGAKYAQKATDLLAEIGADAASVYTLKGGYKAWTAEDGGDAFKQMVISGKEAGALAK